ncbi:MAG: prenyltransferase/squalene oxidase repeat-containing protein [Phycisphaeraceae bacterium]
MTCQTRSRFFAGSALKCITAIAVAAAMLVHPAITPAQDAPVLNISRRPEMITAEVEASIEKGLAFLARTQSKDGGWGKSPSGWGAYPTCMTSLAGLAFLAAGNTPVEGKYADNVRRAVDFVLKMQHPNNNGLFANLAIENSCMHGHGFAMMFLGEVYGMERDPERQEKIKTALEKAIKLTGQSQSRAGGWLYQPNSGGDEGSVTVTQIQGLRSIRNAGIQVPKEIIEKACKYIEISANPDGGIRYQANGGGESRPPITAAAVAVMYNAGQYEHPIAKKALEYTKKVLKGQAGNHAFSGHFYYATLYTGQAMYLSSHENWKEYFPGIRTYFLQNQAKDGSWQGDGVGETYGTAIALLTMQLPYGHLPLLQR